MMDNNALLLLVGAKKSKQTIGEAGQQGFGVGVYGGNPTDLTAMGLSPMQGCEDPASENYGNYTHTNGSVMVFIPAFCYRIGNTSAPSYSRDGANALEIRDAFKGQGGGWILHRAFIDGGQQKLGFFVDKYLCSKDKTGTQAVSVKNGNPISLSKHYEDSWSMPECSGEIRDAITLSRVRGEAYACVSAFQWSALSMLSLAHGQAATSIENCAWYDVNHAYNFPKGCNKNLRDYDDINAVFSPHSGNSDCGKTGSGKPFAKTTHNGQVCGVADVNGCMQQPLLGVYQMTVRGSFGVAKESYSMHNFTKDNYNTTSNFDSTSGFKGDGSYWGNSSYCVFPTETTGANRAMCGVFPVSTGSGAGTKLFGLDYARLHNNVTYAIFAAGHYNAGIIAGVWYRHGFDNPWDGYGDNCGFRAAGYAK